MQNRKRDTGVQKRLLDSVGEGEGGMFQENSIETSILSRVKQIISPGWMHETSAQAWCTGKTQRDWVESGVEREVGGGIGMGNACISMADSCQCMTEPTTYCKLISLQLIIKKKKVNSLENKQQWWCLKLDQGLRYFSPFLYFPNKCTKYLLPFTISNNKNMSFLISESVLQFKNFFVHKHVADMCTRKLLTFSNVYVIPFTPPKRLKVFILYTRIGTD